MVLLLLFYSIKISLQLEHIKVYQGLVEIAVSVCLPTNMLFIHAAEQHFLRVKSLYNLAALGYPRDTWEPTQTDV